MDQNGGEGYVETTADSLRDTELFILHCLGGGPATVPAQQTASPGHSAPSTPHEPDANGGGGGSSGGGGGGPGLARLVSPAITPRFVPTCSDALLAGLGKLAAKYREQGVYVQSHISESVDQMSFVASMHPDEPRDASIFDRHGLLAPRSVMAHAVFLSDPELALMAARGAGIACCPLSNVFFAGADLAVRHCVEDAKVLVGLGTDVAGGYSPSMLTGCRTAVMSSKVMARGAAAGLRDGGHGGAAPAEPGPQATGTAAADAADPAQTELDFRYSFWLATLGGAQVLQVRSAGHAGRLGAIAM